MSQLGPGLITGASDDDPSGIATYSQVGAQFGYALLWTMVLSYPLMAAIQEICGRIGRVTGCGLAANLRKNYPTPLLFFVLLLMSAANVFNLGADIGAMGYDVVRVQAMSGGSYLTLQVMAERVDEKPMTVEDCTQISHAISEKLDADKSFVWIKRGLSPRENDLVNRLGIPGLEFQAEEHRIYPQALRMVIEGRTTPAASGDKDAAG